jgi:hypothetical protein
VGGVVKFCEAMFEGHERSSMDIHNLQDYLSRADNLNLNPVTLWLTAYVWRRDHGNEIPHPYPVKETIWQVEQAVQTFLNQLGCINLEIEDAEAKVSMYEAAKQYEEEQEQGRVRR